MTPKKTASDAAKRASAVNGKGGMQVLRAKVTSPVTRDIPEYATAREVAPLDMKNRGKSSHYLSYINITNFSRYLF